MNLEVEAFCAGCTLFSVFISTSYSKDSRINVKYKLSIGMADWNKGIKQLSGHDELHLWDSNPLTHPLPLTLSLSLFFFVVVVVVAASVLQNVWELKSAILKSKVLMTPTWYLWHGVIETWFNFTISDFLTSYPF